MLVTPEAPYFIDRKFDFYMIQGFEYVLLAEKKEYILKKIYFYVNLFLQHID